MRYFFIGLLLGACSSPSERHDPMPKPSTTIPVPGKEVTVDINPSSPEEEPAPNTDGGSNSSQREGAGGYWAGSDDGGKR